MTRASLLLFALLTACATARPRTANTADLPYPEVMQAATHNSYARSLGMPLLAQLAAGVRCIELDFHLSKIAGRQTLFLGHDYAGHDVAFGAGHDHPESFELYQWTSYLARWSHGNPGHLPLTIILDVKSDLTAQADHLDGFESILYASFEGALYTPVEKAGGPWPSLEALKGRVILVVSGDLATRRAYLSRRSRVAFVEAQANDGSDLDGAEFFAAHADDQRFVFEHAAAGHPTRLWKLNRPLQFRGAGHVTFPATDLPATDWYRDGLRGRFSALKPSE